MADKTGSLGRRGFLGAALMAPVLAGGRIVTAMDAGGPGLDDIPGDPENDISMFCPPTMRRR